MPSYVLIQIICIDGRDQALPDDGAVLIVDDNPALLRSLQRLLKAHGLAVRTFDSAETFCAAANPDEGLCLVLDINLNGGRSGIELKRQLAASGSSVPVIFITGNDSAHVRKEAADAGCLAYLTKPFASRLLLDAISKAAALRKSRSWDRADESWEEG
jgi:FixJ family two-component response regulator